MHWCLPMERLHWHGDSRSAPLPRALRRFVTVCAYSIWVMRFEFSAYASSQIDNDPCDGPASGIEGTLGAGGRATVNLQEQDHCLD
jgi:hypothetical protein